MNFDKDYKSFIRHITAPEKNGTMGPIDFDAQQKAAIRLFVAYLNIIYKNSPTLNDK